MEQERLGVIRGEGKDSVEGKKGHLEDLLNAHACAIDERPEWCVWGRGYSGGKGVLCWIRPEPGDEFMARKIAQLISELHGSATAEMTEWNRDLKEKPVYADGSALKIQDLP